MVAFPEVPEGAGGTIRTGADVVVGALSVVVVLGAVLVVDGAIVAGVTGMARTGDEGDRQRRRGIDGLAAHDEVLSRRPHRRADVNGRGRSCTEQCPGQGSHADHCPSRSRAHGHDVNPPRVVAAVRARTSG